MKGTLFNSPVLKADFFKMSPSATTWWTQCSHMQAISLKFVYITTILCLKQCLCKVADHAVHKSAITGIK